jgi:phage minor structural protein
LELEVERYEDGAIKEKKVRFKNYIGKENYSGFKYGVNLKDIVRTQESKNLVTKLIVSPNNNEYADGKFCTIQKAEQNITGEDYLYNFKYYFDMGMLDEEQFN